MALNLFNKPAETTETPAVLDTTASEESDRTAPAPKEAKEDGFEKAIRTYLEAFGKMQPAFAAKYRSSSKTIRQCCDWLIDQAQKKHMLRSGKCAAMSDEETYGLAVHFFEEDSIKPVTRKTSALTIHPRTLPPHRNPLLRKLLLRRSRNPNPSQTRNPNQPQSQPRNPSPTHPSTSLTSPPRTASTSSKPLTLNP